MQPQDLGLDPGGERRRAHRLAHGYVGVLQLDVLADQRDADRGTRPPLSGHQPLPFRPIRPALRLKAQASHDEFPHPLPPPPPPPGGGPTSYSTSVVTRGTTARASTSQNRAIFSRSSSPTGKSERATITSGEIPIERSSRTAG